MKKIAFLFFTLVGLVSCLDSSTHQNKIVDIKISTLEKFVPSSLLDTHSKVAFINTAGERTTFEITGESENVPSEFNGIKYNRELKSYTLRNVENADLSLVIFMTGSYQNENTPNLVLTCLLLSNTFNEWVPSLDFDDNGEITVGNFDDEVILGTKTFHQVFSNFNLEGNERYSKIYYNFELGFVGYHDENNRVWFLDEYVE